MPSSPESPQHEQSLKNSGDEEPVKPFRSKSDVPFYVCFSLIAAFYLFMILAMLIAESTYTTPAYFFEFLKRPDIIYSTKLSLISCGVTTLLSLCVAVPIGYLMSRHHFPGKTLVDAVLDIPIVLPPLVIGLCLLILFNSSLASSVESFLHTIEHFLGNNLIPFCFLSFLIILGLIFYFLSRHKISSRSVRIGIPVGLTLLAMLLFTRSYLFPKLPNWMPDLTAAGLVEESVTFRDQHPLSLSQHVYSSQYTFEGRGDELIAALKKQWKEDKLLDGDIKLIPQLQRDGTNTGKQLLITTFAAGVDSRFPDGGELELLLTPKKPTEELTKLQAELTEIRNQQEPLQREYQRLRGQLNVGTELSFMWDQLKKVRKQWKSDSLNKSMTVIEQSLTIIEKELVTSQQEINSLQTTSSLKKIEAELSTLQQNLNKLDAGDAKNELQVKQLGLVQMKVDISKLMALKSDLSELEDQIRKASTKRAALNSRWQTESVRWSVSLDIMRPQLSSEKDISPTLAFPVTYEIPSVILAQFMVACAFAVRTMRVTFDQIHPRFEQVALTLGCSRGQAFWRVVFPQAWRGVMAAATLAWARSLGEFGPILIFAGAKPFKTEVLPTSVFLQFSTGDLEGAVSASLIIIFAALVVLITARLLGLRKMSI